MVHMLKIQVKKEIQYINLEHLVNVRPAELGRWLISFVNGDIVEVGGDSAQAIVAYLDSMSIPVGLDINA